MSSSIIPLLPSCFSARRAPLSGVLLVLAWAASAAPPVSAMIAPSLPVDVAGVTNTQVLLQYRVNGSAPCTIQVREAGATTPVNDVNPALFPSANLDVREGNLRDGALRTVVVGHRDVAQARDGKLYSRALQALTRHEFTLDCGEGRGRATGSFTTANIPLGNSAPDPFPFHPKGFGNYGWPTIDFSDQSKTYIDPQTGALIKRWTSAGDASASLAAGFPIIGINDEKHVWQNPAALGYEPDHKLASYQGPGGPQNGLFLRGPIAQYRFGFSPLAFNQLDDVRLRIVGYGSAEDPADRSLAICLSPDYGRSCVGKPVETVLPKGHAGEINTSGNAWPAPLFHAWGDAPVTPEMVSGNFEGAATVDGNQVSWSWGEHTGTNFYFLSNLLKAGDRILLSGTHPYCLHNMCTVQSVSNERRLTIKENIPHWTAQFAALAAPLRKGASEVTVSSAEGFIRDVWGGYYFLLAQDLVSCKALQGNKFSGCSGVGHDFAEGTRTSTGNYYFPNFGFKLWKQNGNGGVFLDSVQSDWAVSAQMFTGFQGVEPYCSAATVTAHYAADGVTPIPPLEGRLCSLLSQWNGSTLYFVAMKTGEVRKLTNLTGLSLWEDGADANKFYAYENNTGQVRTCAYNVNDRRDGRYKAWSDGRNESLINPAFRCDATVTGGDGKDVPTQIHRAFPQIDLQYFGPPHFDGMYGTLMTFSMKPRQDALAWFCLVDVAREPGHQVVGCRNTWDTHPVRWNGAHGTQIFNGPYLQLISMNSLLIPGANGIERWQLRLNRVYGQKDTALPAAFVDPQTCEELGVTDKRWINVGATGRHCIHVNVAGEPLAPGAAASDLGALNGLPAGAKPVAWKHNAARCGGDGTTAECASFLQPMEEGDGLGDAAQDSGGEKFLIAKKTPLRDGSIDLVLLRNANPSRCQASDQPSGHGVGWAPVILAPYTCSGGTYWQKLGDPVRRTFIDNPTRSGADNGLYGGHTVVKISGDDFLQFTPYVWNWGAEYGGYGAGYGVRKGKFPAVISQGAQYGVNDIYPFAGRKQGIHIGFIQSHPGAGQYEAAPREQVWGMDGRPLGGAGGGALGLWYQQVTPLPGTGQVYRVGLPTEAPHGKILSFGENNYDVRLDRKRRLVVGFAGYHQLRDVSGPHSRIGDRDDWTFCIADFADECVPGSTRGDQFVSVPHANTEGQCSADYAINAPCLATVGPQVAGYTQFDVSRADPDGLRWRKLTSMFGGPGRTNNYANMHTTPGAEWAVSTVFWGDGRRSDVFGLKLPPWPEADPVKRNGFVHIPVTVEAQPGTAAVRIRFGYDLQLNCTTRNEACSTANSGDEPFAWLSEPQRWQTCGGEACVVTVPAIANRVLYYVVDRQQSDGTVKSAAMQAIVTP